MGIYRGVGGTGDASGGATVSEVAAYSVAAEDSAEAAAASASAAASSALAAAGSSSAAAASEASVAADAAAAASSASAALTSETNASTSETNAADSATASAGSATSAASSATNAASSATAASSSATAAASSASAASTSATNAASSASAAATSATNAANSASAALTSETNAASSASAASGSATASATSATNAANSASAATTSATNAASSASAAASSATTAQTAETNAAASASAAASSASTADTSADDAASSASAAASSATNAFNSASAASTSATNAANSATAASASASAASASADAALSALDSFDDRYLGQKSVEPTVDNDGNPLVTGALYFNTVDNAMKVYDGMQWLNAYASLSGALIATNNLSDLVSASSARTNLGLGTAATTNSTAYATAAQGALADSAVQPGDLATVATSGSYTDLSNKPTLGTAAATDSTAYATAAQGTKADTAYGWGNHASVGYASDADVVKLTGDQTVAGTKTFSSNPTLSGATANGVMYANGSKVLTSGSALTFDGTNLIVGASAIPSGWGGNNRLSVKQAASAAINGLVVNASANDSGVFLGHTGSVATLGVSYGSTGAYAPLTFEVNGSEAMRLTSTGLGIGTSSPSKPLEVYNTTEATVWARTTTGYSLLRAGGTGGDFYFGIDNSSGSGFGQGNYSRVIYSTGAYPIVFSTNAAERLRIDSSGNLGLGVTPSAWSTVTALQIKNAAFGGYLQTAYVTGNAYYNSGWKYIANAAASNYQANFNNDGSHAWFIAPSGTAGNAISFTQAMTLNADGNLGLGNSSPGGNSINRQFTMAGSLTSQITQQNGTNTANFGVNPSSTVYLESTGAYPIALYTNGSERARIDSSGNVGIGTASPSYKLHVAGDIYATGNVTAYSDRTLKDNIKTVDNALGLVSQMRGVTYTRKDTGEAGVGVIAQEMQEVLPEVVMNKDGVMGVAYGNIVGVLIEAIKEQSAQIAELRAEIQTLKGE